jgi:hypothetical protein
MSHNPPRPITQGLDLALTTRTLLAVLPRWTLRRKSLKASDLMVEPLLQAVSAKHLPRMDLGLSHLLKTLEAEDLTALEEEDAAEVGEEAEDVVDSDIITEEDSMIGATEAVLTAIAMVGSTTTGSTEAVASTETTTSMKAETSITSITSRAVSTTT